MQLVLFLATSVALVALSQTMLVEMTGFHCMMQHSFKMNRNTHGKPRITEPPFEFTVEDTEGNTIKYYKPGEVYVAKLLGLISYRGILIQPRLTDESGFLIGSLRGGMFIQEEIWEHYGIRFQECDTSAQTNDTVTHKNDFKKFLTKIKWIADRDVGPVQFLITVAQDKDIYWERWRPRSGFILPESLRGKDIKIVDALFHNEDDAGRNDLAFVSANSSGDGVKFLDGIGVKSEHELNGTDESSNITTTPVAVLSTTMSHEELLKNLENENVPVMIRERLKMRLKLLEKSGSTTKGPSQEENGLVIDPSIVPTNLVQVIADPGPWMPSESSNTTENSTQTPVVVFTKPANPILVDRASRRGKVWLLPITEDRRDLTTKTEPETTKTTEAVTEPEEPVSEVETLKDLDKEAPISLGVNSPPLEAEESIDAEKKGKDKNSEEKSDFPIAFKSMPLSPKLAKVIGADNGAIINPCKEGICQNDGKCSELEKTKESAEEFGDENYICTCVSGWTGQNCEVKDYCLDHKCKNGHCRNSASNYTCECFDEFVGQHCHRKCPPGMCENDGKCMEKGDGELGCACVPGTTGEKCEIDIDECAARPCKHSSSCNNTGLNDFECKCVDGWMGKICDRPCQDVYKSCKTWKKQEQCELMRPHTTFFDINCAVSCDQCVFVNKTIRTAKPLPPVLLPLAWTLGVWMADVKSSVNFPMDFDSTDQYNEIMTFVVSDALMFGTPSINFTSIATNKKDPLDQHVQNGFLTIRPKPDHDQQAALLTTSNHGLMMIEEGQILNKGILFSPHFQSPFPLTEKRLPKKMKRMFSKSGPLLLVSISKRNADGSTKNISKYFTRVKEFEYL